MISYFINEPDHWRARAEEARNLANQMNDSESKDAMLRIARDYERLARRAEHRAAGRPPNWIRH
jgi:molecular chaperone GrpE (heat shock protein)